MLWTRVMDGLEEAEQLDRVTDAVTGAVNTVLPAGPVKDLLHGKFLGHPLHPLLVALPIGMWSGTTLLDLLGGKGSRRAARTLVGAGVAAVAPTALAGWADWSELGLARRAKRVGLAHAAANTTTALLYAASWRARRRGDHLRGRNLALAGMAGLSVGGYLGGHLSYSQGVGVDRNADEAKGPREWTDAAAVADVVEGVPRRVEVEGHQIALVRQGDVVRAIGAVCSHLGGPLDEGEVQGCRLVCPWHGSRFRQDDGAVERGPATAPQPAYEVRTRGDRLELRARA